MMKVSCMYLIGKSFWIEAWKSSRNLHFDYNFSEMPIELLTPLYEIIGNHQEVFDRKRQLFEVDV